MSDCYKLYAQFKKTYPEPFRVRVYRSLSWLKAASSCNNEDMRFILVWIAFNAAYGKDSMQTDFENYERKGDRAGFKDFISVLCILDDKKLIYNLVWYEFSNSIRHLLNNRYCFMPFWSFYNGNQANEDWEIKFNKAIKKVNETLVSQDTETLLSILFDRLYTLRNQLFHGGSTFSSSANRAQVRDGIVILDKMVPLFLTLMQQHPNEGIWGKPYYPFVED